MTCDNSCKRLASSLTVPMCFTSSTVINWTRILFTTIFDTCYSMETRSVTDVSFCFWNPHPSIWTLRINSTWIQIWVQICYTNLSQASFQCSITNCNSTKCWITNWHRTWQEAKKCTHALNYGSFIGRQALSQWTFQSFDGDGTFEAVQLVLVLTLSPPTVTACCSTQQMHGCRVATK